MAEVDSSENRLVLDYTARDFDSIRSLLVGIAQGKFPEWLTIGEAGDFGTLLLELFAYMGDIQHHYIDRVGSEAFLGTAQRRQSVLFIADQFGYTPIAQQAATVVLRASLGQDEVAPLTIPAGSKLISSGTVEATFETDFDLTLSPGDVDRFVTATEGKTVTQSLGLSKGVPNAEFVLPDPGVIYQTITINTIEAGTMVEWSFVDNIILARPNQSAFAAYVDDQNSTHILFGDNAAGRIPPIGVEIQATYRYGVGAAANNIAPGEVTSLQTGPGLGYIPSSLTITNYDRPLGGSDVESVDAMRFSIPKASTVQNRAVTLDDYIGLAMQVPGVGKATAYGQVYSNVTIRIANTGGIEPSDIVDPENPGDPLLPLRNKVAAALEIKKLIGSNLFIEDVWQKSDQGWEDATVVMDVHVQPGFNRTQTVSRVRTEIESLFAFDNVDFGKRISIGQVYRAAVAVEGVDWVDLLEYHGSTTTSGLVSDVITPALKIPRIRPQQTDLLNNSEVVTVEYGLVLNGFGGLVNT